MEFHIPSCFNCHMVINFLETAIDKNQWLISRWERHVLKETITYCRIRQSWCQDSVHVYVIYVIHYIPLRFSVFNSTTNRRSNLCPRIIQYNVLNPGSTDLHYSTKWAKFQIKRSSSIQQRRHISSVDMQLQSMPCISSPTTCDSSRAMQKDG